MQDANFKWKNMHKIITTITREGEHTERICIGKAFVNKDQSINIYLDALPINGKLTLTNEKE